ncbi:MAG: poly-gamma-glutamate hydrolase family protein [Anaerolineales bacterium]
MPARDIYHNFLQLAGAESEGRDYRIELISRPGPVAILAPHGGGIEPGTAELAAALAAEQHSLYIFDGCKLGESRRLHITSTRFDEPRCLGLLTQVMIVVAVHGCAGERQAVYTGGRDGPLQERVLHQLAQDGFHAQPDKPARAGLHPHNVCNRGRHGRGLQLELTEGLRRAMFHTLDRQGRQHPTPIFHRLVHSLSRALDEHLCHFKA